MLFVSVLLELLPVLLPALAPLLRGVALELELLGAVAELLLLDGVFVELKVALLDGLELVSVDMVEEERVLLELFIAEPL